jgi:hypothetical protein
MSVHELDTFFTEWLSRLLIINGGVALIFSQWGLAAYLYGMGALYLWLYRKELKSQIAIIDKKIEGCEAEILSELSKMGIKPINVRPLNS